jgi:CHAT domain-containing protein
VPDGTLQSLPPALLVTQEPTAPIAGFTDYASVAWLARRYALTVLPAVSSLTSLRRFAEGRHGGSPFVGFGNPDFKGRLAPLPDTARLLRAEAKVLHAPVSSVYLSHEATVTKVKSLDLGDTRVVAFATHGLSAGDMKALAEPALALTPASQDDDGLFRASEVSQLQLNADWVLLTACNTAAPDGSPGGGRALRPRQGVLLCRGTVAPRITLAGRVRGDRETDHGCIPHPRERSQHGPGRGFPSCDAGDDRRRRQVGKSRV